MVCDDLDTAKAKQKAADEDHVVLEQNGELLLWVDIYND